MVNTGKQQPHAKDKGQGQHGKRLIEQQEQGKQHRQNTVCQEPASPEHLPVPLCKYHDVNDAGNQHGNPEAEGHRQQSDIRIAQAKDTGNNQNDAGNDPQNT